MRSLGLNLPTRLGALFLIIMMCASPGGPSEDLGYKIFLQTDDELIDLLTRCRRHLRDGRQDELLADLEKLEGRLAARGEHAEGLQPLYPTGEGGYTSLADQVQGLVAELPPQALAAYRSRIEAQAQAHLDRAGDDQAQLAEVVARYRPSGAGQAALERLADLARLGGDLGRARHAYLRLAQPSSAALAKLAFCQRLLGDAAGLAQSLERLGNGPIAVAGNERAPADWLRELATPGPSSELPTADYEPGATRWRLPPRDPQIEATDLVQLIRRELPRPLPFLPAAAADGIYIVGARSVQAVDPESGQPRWRYLAGEPPLWRERWFNQIYSPALGPTLVYAVVNPQPEVVYRETPKAEKPPDEGGGENPPDEQEPPDPPPARPEDEQGRIDAYDCQPGLRVVALRRDNGQLAWDSATDPDFLPIALEADALTAPTYHDGLVYVGATLASDKKDMQSFLLALDAATGRVVWKTFILSGFIPNPFGLGSQGARPLVTQDAVVYQTNLGALVACDPYDGSIRWLQRYDADPAPTRDDIAERTQRPDLADPVASGAALFALPQDAPFCYGLDLRSGRILWRRPRQGARQILGLAGGRLWLGGPRLLGLDPDAGKLVEIHELPGAGQTARGCALGDQLYLPCQDRVVRVRVGVGPTVRVEVFGGPADELGGHLVRFGRRLLVAGADLVYCLQDRRDDPPEFNGPDAVGQILEHSRALGHAEAIAWLEAKRPLLPAAERSLVTARILQRQAERARESAAEGRLDQAAQFLSAALEGAYADIGIIDPLLLLADLHERQGDLRAELRDLTRLLIHHARRPHALAQGWVVPLYLGLRSRLREVARRGGPAAYAEQEVEVQQLLDVAAQTHTKENYEQIVEAYPASAQVPQAYRALAQHYAGLKALDQAARCLRELLDHEPDLESRAAVRLELAELYRQLDLSDRRRAILREVVADAQAPAAQRDAARALLGQPDERRSARPAVLPVPGERGLTLAWQTPIDLSQMNARWLLPREGEAAKDEGFLILSEGELLLRDARDGEIRWRAPAGTVGEGGREADLALCGDTLLVAEGRQILGLESVRGTPRFSRTLEATEREAAEGEPGRVKPAARIMGMAGNAACAVVLTGAQQALGISPADGQTLWERAFEQPLYRPQTPIIVGEQVILVREKPAALLVLSLASGDIIKELPLEHPDPRVTHTPILSQGHTDLEGRLYLIVAGSTLLGLDADSGRPLWPALKLPFWVRQLELAPGGEDLVLMPFSADHTPDLVVVSAHTGKERWRSEGQAGLASRFYLGAQDVYLLKSQQQAFELLSFNRADGNLRWRWTAPPGQRFDALQATQDVIVLPQIGQLPGRVHLLEVATGKVLDQLTLPIRRIHAARALAETLVIVTDKGILGYRARPEKEIQAELDVALTKLAAEPRDDARRRAAARSQLALGHPEQGCDLLEPGLLREGLTPEAHGDLRRLLNALREAMADRRAEAHRVPFLARPPAIDGELSDWYFPERGLDLDRPRDVSALHGGDLGAPVWAGKEDLSARLHWGWDRRHFYFVLDVQDDRLRPYDGDAPDWKGDCLLIALDPMNNGGAWCRPDDSLLTLALMLPRRNKTKEEEEEEKRRRPRGRYFVRRKDDGSGAIYEAALPWTLFKENGAPIDPLQAQRGWTFGLNLILTDDDGLAGGATKFLSLTPSVLLHQTKSRLWEGFVPEHFVKIVLD